MPCLLYANDLVLCGESKKDLRAMMRCFFEVYRRRCIKVRADKSNMMVLSGQEGLECEVLVDGVRLDHASGFKYLGCVLDESGTDEAGG